MGLDKAIRSIGEEAEAARETVRWTRRYAQSRTLPVLVSLAVTGPLFIALLAGWAALGCFYRSDQMAFFVLCAVALAIMNGLLVWLSVPRWGGAWLERLSWRYYDREGSVKVPGAMAPDRMKKTGRILGLLFAAAIVTHVTLGVGGYLSLETMLPVAALYTIPFSMFIALATRSYFLLLYPLFFGLHALLLVAGVPFHYTNNPAFDFLIAVFAYRTLAGLIGHVYNRYALARLKRVAQARIEDVEGV